MDNRDKAFGKGRGTYLLEMMKQRESERPKRKLFDSLETPSGSSLDERSFLSSAQTSFSSNVNTSSERSERFQLIDKIRSINKSSLESQDSLQSDERETSPKINQGISRGLGRGLCRGIDYKIGRGAILGIMQGSTPDQPRISPQVGNIATKSSVQTYDPTGVLGTLADLSIYDKPPAPDAEHFEDAEDAEDAEEIEGATPVCRQGFSGKTINAFSNYIDLSIEPGKGLFQYSVKFEPNIDSKMLRRKMLNQHSVELGRTKTFDGSILYLPMKLERNITRYYSEHPGDGSKVTVIITYTKRQSMSENIQFFNVLLGRIMRALKLVRIGRQHFKPENAHVIEQHRLEVWPGYVTAINEYEGGLKLCLDAKHRVMRTQTVRDIMADIYSKCQITKENYKDAVVREVVGSSVLTRYNNKTYRIDDIAWNETPKTEFLKDGKNVSLVNYYLVQHKIEIKDLKQPLLIHRVKEKSPTGEKQERILLLVPELSYAAGLTDGIRTNYKIMKDLNQITKMSPNNRWNMMQRFLKDIEDSEIAREILLEWGLKLNNDIVQFSGRCLEPEVIKFGKNRTYSLRNKISDWGSAAANNPVFYTPNLNNWCILHIARDRNNVQGFLEMLQKIASAIGMHINPPRLIIVRDDRTESYLREIQNNFTERLELIVIVFPSNRSDRYSAVKKLCCVHKPIASQVIMSRTISNAAKLKSITEKIALQINCKLGGALWSIVLPLKHCMICGIDVYHGGLGTRAKGSVAGFVASLDADLTKWHSRTCMQAKNQELVDMLQMCLISAINAYYRHNKAYPERIIIYRDGVGDGDLDYVAKYEVKQLLMTLERVEQNYKPQISVIVVQKRINTRIFTGSNTQNLENPSAGTVIDSCVTRRNYYDFFLVPQNIREGTVTPTHYIVIHDSSNMQTDHMQRLTYKLCYLYYNWAGTIRIPAPCQYAHKLVYQVGQNIQAEPHQSLLNTLYYL